MQSSVHHRRVLWGAKESKKSTNRTTTFRRVPAKKEKKRRDGPEGIHGVPISKKKKTEGIKYRMRTTRNDAGGDWKKNAKVL